MIGCGGRVGMNHSRTEAMPVLRRRAVAGEVTSEEAEFASFGVISLEKVLLLTLAAQVPFVK